VMYAGKIVEYGDVHSIFKRPRHPYTRALIQSLPRIGERNVRLPAIEGQPPSMEDLPSGCSFHPRCPYRVDVCDKIEPALEFADGHGASCHVFAPGKTTAG